MGSSVDEDAFQSASSQADNDAVKKVWCSQCTFIGVLTTFRPDVLWVSDFTASSTEKTQATRNTLITVPLLSVSKLPT